ncbi:energy transducer TonB [Pelovirga terrestris]|uniref:Energy transducer TonB n=1 Tax=Pelovirga terrestris TaxID=2771352 RepID=A0A8J6UKI9_9BACT|nr:energy transducer TonB [Pelovirga terrestris]MBD1399482.1 energy transducer TonB [Pelovirga terrestris]
MRILGFILSAAVLHVVVLVLTPDSSNQRFDDILVGVELVQRQMDSSATADTFSEGQESTATDRSEPSLPDRIDNVVAVEVATSPEPVNELIEPKRAVAMNRPAPQPIPGPYQQPLPDDTTVAATPDNNSAPVLAQVTQQAVDRHAEAEAVPVLQRSLSEQPAVRPAKAKKAESIDGIRAPLIEQVAAAPRYGYHPAPAYPRLARHRGWEGTVEFKVRVLPDGQVGEVTLISSSGYKNLDQAAHRAINRWRFTPASRAGKVVESWVVVPVHFVLDGQPRTP